MTLKRDGAIPDIVSRQNPAEFLSSVLFLDAAASIIPLYLSYMRQYNLLPNDALILATCKLNGIHTLASYDSDFATSCTAEGIRLVQTVADLTA